MNEDEKKYLIDQANLYLQGKSLREIATIIGKSHITVRNNLTKKLKEADPRIYLEVMEKLTDNQEKTIEDKIVRKRVLEAYYLLVEKNKTIKEIANILSTTENTIYRDLTSRLNQMNVLNSELVTSQMLEKASNVLKKHSLYNFVGLASEKEKDAQKLLFKNIYKMFPTKEKRNKFLTDCILTFGLQAKTISYALGFNEEHFKQSILEDNPKYHNLTTVFNHTMKHQQQAINEFISFIDKLTIASLKNNKEQIVLLLEEISDKKACIIAKRDLSRPTALTDEEIITILKYQIKYMISSIQIEKIFHIENTKYAKRVRKLSDSNPKLVSEFDYITDFYANNNFKYTGRR